jgi:hypothetical protein
MYTHNGTNTYDNSKTLPASAKIGPIPLPFSEDIQGVYRVVYLNFVSSDIRFLYIPSYFKTHSIISSISFCEKIDCILPQNAITTLPPPIIVESLPDKDEEVLWLRY